MKKPKKAPRLQTLTLRTRLVTCLALGLSVAAGTSWLRRTNAVGAIEDLLIDSRTHTYLGTRPADPSIVMAVIAESDLTDLKNESVEWPWELEVNADAFRWFKEAGARAVMVDVLQFDKGTGPDEIDIPPGVADRKSVLEFAGYAAASAAVLGEAYADLGSVVLATNLGSGPHQQTPAAVRARTPAFLRHLAALPPRETRTRLQRDYVMLPVLGLLDKAAGIGFASVGADDTSTIRRHFPVARAGVHTLVSLPCAVAAVIEPATTAFGPEWVAVGGARQRVDEDGAFHVNFRGEQGQYARVAPADCIHAAQGLEAWIAGGRVGPVPSRGTATPDSVRGKIVVWGANLPGIKDLVPVSFDESFPGPEFQATVLDNLLHGDGRVAVPRGLNSAISIALAVLIALFGALALPRGVFPASALLAAGAVVGLGYLLFERGHVLDVFTPVLAVGLSYASVLGFRLLTEGRRNRWLEGTFSKYLSPAVIEALKDNPNLISLGGRRTEITVLFSDVKGFTSISEQLSPDNLVRLLNRYLTRQAAEVLAEDGVIDKFIGDAVMAFFGDPLPVPDHALRACRAAVACRKALPDMMPLTKELGLEALENRLGINSGPATVGNMGSENRFDYTCMGDTVNLASRLEGANKAFGSGILIGQGTYEAAKDAIVAKPLARLQVVGKTEAMQVYELLDVREKAPEDLVRHAEAFTAAVAAARADDLVAARERLREALDARPKDGPCKWLAHVLDDLERGHLRRPWSGLYVLESK